MTKTVPCVCLSLWLAWSCLAQTPGAVCPQHIETPAYPPIARIAHVTGKVILKLTLDADGKVSDAKVVNDDDKGVGLLKLGSIDNVHLWSFAKPPTAPYTQIWFTTTSWTTRFPERAARLLCPQSLRSLTTCRNA